MTPEILCGSAIEAMLLKMSFDCSNLYVVQFKIHVDKKEKQKKQIK